MRAKILPKKHKTFYFPASSELFLARELVFRVVSPSLVVGAEGMAAYTAMPGVFPGQRGIKPRVCDKLSQK